MAGDNNNNNDNTKDHRSVLYDPVPLYAMTEGNDNTNDDDDMAKDAAVIEEMDVDTPFLDQKGRIFADRKYWSSSRISGAVIAVLILILVGLLFVPASPEHGASDKAGSDPHIPENSELSSDIGNYENTTTYGRRLQDWQLDTSRAYHLNQNGKKWDSNAPPATREHHFTITEITASPDGVAKKMTVINGQFPGPVIEANDGDRIVVHVHNRASTPTSLHFHGLHQNGTNHMDGAIGVTQCGIRPGGDFTYDFTVKDQWGTYWYHSHYSTQYVEGFAGPVVIHSPKEDGLLEYDEDVVIFLSDLYHDSSYDLLEKYIAPNVENQEPIPDSGLVQGANYFDCGKLHEGNGEINYECSQETSQRTVIPVLHDRTYRIRLVSAGAFSEFDFSIDNHTLTVVEADGTNTEPLDVEVVRLSNAQRYSVLVSTKADDTEGGFWLRAGMNTYCYDGENPNLDPNLRAVLAYPKLTDKIIANNGVVSESMEPQTSKSRELDGTIRCRELDPRLLVPSIPISPPEPDEFIAVDASFQIGAHKIALGYFNDTTFKQSKDGIPTLEKIRNGVKEQNPDILSQESTTPDWADNQLVVSINKPKAIDLLINNYDDGAHPFHLHGYKMWELAYGQGYYEPEMYSQINTTNPIRRDTIQTRKVFQNYINFQFTNQY